MEIKTASGFSLTIDQDVLDDWELIEDLSELIDNDNPIKAISAMKRILGVEQYNALKTFLKDRDGKVKTSAMVEEFGSIMASEELKK